MQRCEEEFRRKKNYDLSLTRKKNRICEEEKIWGEDRSRVVVKGKWFGRNYICISRKPNSQNKKLRLKEKRKNGTITISLEGQRYTSHHFSRITVLDLPVRLSVFSLKVACRKQFNELFDLSSTIHMDWFVWFFCFFFFVFFFFFLFVCLFVLSVCFLFCF